MTGRRTTPRRLNERGQVIVLFALLVPVIFAVGSIVMSVGNWYVLKRHLQTQVDAAALAGGPAFTGCAQDPATTNVNIRQQALQYAGDTLRHNSPYNLQLQEAGDQRIVLNSASFWADGNATDGTGLDDTLGTPCDTKFLDVKATDDEAPLLWKWIPLFPNLKARARVEIRQVEALEGVRPLGVPEVLPEQVAVLIVDEYGSANNAGSVRGKSLLDWQSVEPTGLEAYSVWSKDNIAPVGINGSDSFGVIVVLTRSTTPLNLNGTISQICSQSQARCYGGNTLTSGISHIRRYVTSGTGGHTNHIVRDVSLGGGCPDDLARPYFNLAGGCPLGIVATIDFGTGSNDPRGTAAQGGACAVVTASPGGTLQWLGNSAQGSIWGNASFTPAAESGANQVNLTTRTDVTGNCNNPGRRTQTHNRVAKPYVADDDSGPVQYLQVELSGGGLANSMAQNSSASLDITVGLSPPLEDAALSDPPIPLRIWDTPSQTQALDCGSGSGPNGWNGKMQEGCEPYQIYDESKHTSLCTPAISPPDCIASQNGNFQQNTLRDMFPCQTAPNNWNGLTLPDFSDPRWIPLFIVDELAFTQSGKKWYPIRRFGMFYVTAASGLDCPGDNPATNLSGKREMWGHFSTYVTPGWGDVVLSDELCSFTDGGICVTSLVE